MWCVEKVSELERKKSFKKTTEKSENEEWKRAKKRKRQRQRKSKE